jgi:hypothetical protein
LKSSAIKENLNIGDNEIGKVVWHTLTEDGKIEFYDIKFGNKMIYNVPESEIVTESVTEHMHETREKRIY